MADDDNDDKPSRESVLETIGPVQRFGPYLLIKKLATGGMAEVWLARQSGVAGFHRFVVVKKMLSHLAEQEEFVTMFLDEARTTVRLGHPNVVAVYDLGESDGSYFLAMEYIAGETLASISWRSKKKHVPLPATLAARMIADACKGLHHAHTLKDATGAPLEIVHRDVSPQNILVNYEGEVKVVDFGIAKAATKSQHTKTGMLKGKFSYMSPEQILGQALDGRSDVFALGIVLYELSTGTRLFKHESELMILEMVTKRPVVPPSSVNSEISPELDAIIMRALEKDPNTRYLSAEQMQLDLERYISESGRVSTSDVASFMRQLYAHRIAEKGLLMEIAGEAGFEERFLVGREPPKGPPRPRPLDATQPHAVVERDGRAEAYPPAAMWNGQPLPPGFTHPSQLAAMQAYGGQYTGQYTGQYSGQYPPHALPAPPARTSPWALGVLAVSLLVILGAAAYLAVGTGKAPVEIGQVRIESDPPSAQVMIDGKQQRVGDQFATTPTHLQLQHGKSYVLRIERPGYHAFEQTIAMNPGFEGQTISTKLRAKEVELTVHVEPADLEPIVRLDNVSIPPDKPWKVDPSRKHALVVLLQKYECPKEEEIELAVGESRKISVRCEPKVQPKPDAGTRPGRRDGGQPPPPPPPPPPKDKCVANPSQPAEVTFMTKPVTDVFYKGKLLGQIPLPGVSLPSGCIEITFVNPKNKKKVTIPMKAQPNKSLVFRRDLSADLD